MGNSATDKYSCKVARAKPSSAAEIGANTCPQKSSGRWDVMLRMWMTSFVSCLCFDQIESSPALGSPGTLQVADPAHIHRTLHRGVPSIQAHRILIHTLFLSLKIFNNIQECNNEELWQIPHNQSGGEEWCYIDAPASPARHIMILSQWILLDSHSSSCFLVIIPHQHTPLLAGLNISIVMYFLM